MSRVTVTVKHPRKTFYEQFLETWKRAALEERENTGKGYMAVTLAKAITNIKQFPLEVCGIVDLKSIEGIGEKIAVRCEQAWQLASSELEMTLAQVKSLSKEDYLSFYNGTKSLKRFASENRMMLKKTTEQHTTNDDEFVEPVQAKKSRSAKLTVSTAASEAKASATTVQSSSANPVATFDDACSSTSSGNVNECSLQFISCEPSDRPEVILIADMREHIGNRRGTSVTDHLEKMSCRSEKRQLSAGDFIWVARTCTGVEVVLDWIVERKTWDDLKHSIIGSTRYEDQKQRMRKTPIRNRVYLIEGSGRGDMRGEQALRTTSAGGFLIQRCDNVHDTAVFLDSITQHLQESAKLKKLTGLSFESFQNLTKKTSADTVRHVWQRQLMVCPGMSHRIAKSVALKFPSMWSIGQLYSDNCAPDKLNKHVTQVNKTSSAIIASFISNAR